MRAPGQNRKQSSIAEEFINGADSGKLPWEKNLNKKYDRDTGKIINVRLPQYYAECLEYLSELDNRSQHSKLVQLIKLGIEKEVKDTKKVLKQY